MSISNCYIQSIINYCAIFLKGKQEQIRAVLYNFLTPKLWNWHILAHVWTNQYFVSASWLYIIVKQSIKDNFKQYYNLYNSPKALTYVVSSNPVHREVYSIQHYVIQFVSDLQQVGGFLWVLRFPQPIKLTATK
jgi:hypothetical protein